MPRPPVPRRPRKAACLSQSPLGTMVGLLGQRGSAPLQTQFSVLAFPFQVEGTDWTFFSLGAYGASLPSYGPQVTSRAWGLLAGGGQLCLSPKALCPLLGAKRS